MSAEFSPLNAATLRLLDAAANRAAEGLRVVEDYARFVQNDGLLTNELKQLRHELVRCLAVVPVASRLHARDTPSDVGTSITTANEQQRADLAAVVTANWKRLQEALRSLEEYLKTISTTAAQQCEVLRYRSYTLEQIQHNLALSQIRLKSARLYVLIDGCPSEAALVDLVQQLIQGGVDLIQLRDKQLNDRELLARGKLIRQTIQEFASHQALATHRPLFIMNDRPDLALLSQADGVHVGQSELPVSAVRQLVGPQMLIGVSTHSLEQAQRAMLDGASYIGVGPTFASQTKEFDQFTGLELLREIASQSSLPAFAIGGITLENLASVLATGCQRVAVSAAIQRAVSPREQATRFAQQLIAAAN